MKERIIKGILNFLALLIVLKVLHSTKTNLSSWEKSNELELKNLDFIKILNCTIENLASLNDKLVFKLDDLRKTLYFKIFKVNLDNECTYFTQNMICNFPSCGVCQCQDSEIPLPWKQGSNKREELNSRIEDKFQKWIDKYNVSTSEWLVDSEINSIDGSYINLLQNPEAYTGYQGQHIWNAIFKENCFSDKLDQICIEEKVFYKIFSGLLSNINILLSVNYYDLARNLTYTNVTMFNERFANHPERVENFFFLYSLLIKALVKSDNIISHTEFSTGNQTEDNNTVNILKSIFESGELKEFSEICAGDNEEIKKFLSFNKMEQLVSRFRNISSIIDCVSCQKCKLHGKLQLYGIATMLKILFFKNVNNSKLELSRNEIISFINFLGKVSKSINYIRRINDNIRYSHFVYKFKFLFLIICYGILFFYVNFFLFRKKHSTQDIKTKTQ